MFSLNKHPFQIVFRFLPLFILPLLGAVLLSFQTAATAAPTATFNVNVSFDAADANVGDGLCAISANLGGACTLRAAIQEANASAGSDTINLPSSVYLITIGGSDSSLAPNAATGDLDITTAAGVVIEGNNSIIINNASTTGFNSFVTLDINQDAVATINDITIQNSTRAIDSRGPLTLNNVTVKDPLLQSNGSPASTTPGILSTHNFTATNLTISNLGNVFSVLSIGGADKTTVLNGLVVENSTGLFGTIALGGGNNHDLELRNSRITGLGATNNTASGLSVNSGAGHTIIIDDVTISNQNGNGISYSSASNSSLLVTNSTLSGNRNAGISAAGSTNTISLNNVTITNNAGVNGFPGGIHIFTNSLPTVNIQNSIIGGNQSTGANADCLGTFTSGGNNIISSVTGCTINGDTTGNITGEAPDLAPLADNGGVGHTHALLTGSPAINAGGTDCEVDDQLGTARPIGSACDIGAVEGASGAAVPPTITTIVPNSGTQGTGGFTLTVNGTGFSGSSVVRWKGLARETTFVNATQITAAIPASDMVRGGTAGVTVFDSSQGVSSNSVNFTINNPLPVISSISPTTVREGLSAGVVVNGTGFNADSRVLMDGVQIPTTFRAGVLRAVVPSSATTPVGKEITLRVQNPTPGGGTSSQFRVLTVISDVVVGNGAITPTLGTSQELSTFTLNWVHPTDWRELESMEFRLLDEEGNVVMWLGFVEEFGTQGAIALMDEGGNIAALGFAGDDTELVGPFGTLKLADTVLNAAPGTTIEVVYAVQFSKAMEGRTFHVEMNATEPLSGENADANGFEPAGDITVPMSLFLPIVVRN